MGLVFGLLCRAGGVTREIVKARRLDRRSLLAALAAGALVGACSENPETRRNQFVVVDDAQLAELADTAWADLLAKTPQVRGGPMPARLDRIGRRLAAASGLERPWGFAVLDSPEINAFVLPNGKVAAFRGLMELARDDDELGGVLGHEVGHILARHPAERVSQQLAVQVGVGVLEAVLSQGEYAQHAGQIASALGMGAVYGVILPYSRKHELEADAVGVELMQRAGMDPQGALRFFAKLNEASAGKAQPPEVLSTHPATEARLAALREAVARLPKG